MLKKFYKIIIVPYTLFLLYLLFLGMGRFQYDDNLLTIKPIVSTINFIKGASSWMDIVTIVLGNIIMFIPFGFLGWIFPTLKDLKSLLFTFISVIFIVEALQYFTRMGIFEIDDIILNTSGVYLGFLLCRFVEKRFEELV
ncbi:MULTISPECIES: VanZ family protein [Chryseobacterium]|uniref:Glycopeptide antibiotics resistance protein n=1 Tax=Chryseobacterium geocarposphaerae TaxID=1416776 RepID=A0ABU1LD46_9FLAO|nr:MULTISPECIES: VanZ family protein [Chryseobacterium]MDR6404629.1 glycopeptide antibiotics resistance protein [Chryseobacterium geocarposphaerae]MDR6698138.1 glycopeptide antibiotics resistance protein [Chryseobacterium ginsenosidimutans]